MTKAEVAGMLSSPALCYVEYAGDATDKIAARQQLAARGGFSCGPDQIREGKDDFRAFQAIIAARQAQAAQADAASRATALELGLRLLSPPQPTRPQQCQWQQNSNGTGSVVCY
jgi:hypothetical protein